MCFAHLRAITACPFATSQLPKVFRRWCVLYILTSKRALRHNGVQFFISHLPRWLCARRFSEPTFRLSEPQITGKPQCLAFSRACIFFLLALSLLWSSFFFFSPLWFFPPLLFHLSILSEVWLLNFLRPQKHIEYRNHGQGQVRRNPTAHQQLQVITCRHGHQHLGYRWPYSIFPPCRLSSALANVSSENCTPCPHHCLILLSWVTVLLHTYTYLYCLYYLTFTLEGRPTSKHGRWLGLVLAPTLIGIRVRRNDDFVEWNGATATPPRQWTFHSQNAAWNGHFMSPYMSPSFVAEVGCRIHYISLPMWCRIRCMSLPMWLVLPEHSCSDNSDQSICYHPKMYDFAQFNVQPLRSFLSLPEARWKLCGWQGFLQHTVGGNRQLFATLQGRVSSSFRLVAMCCIWKVQEKTRLWFCIAFCQNLTGIQTTSLPIPSQTKYRHGTTYHLPTTNNLWIWLFACRGKRRN